MSTDISEDRNQTFREQHPDGPIRFSLITEELEETGLSSGSARKITEVLERIYEREVLTRADLKNTENRLQIEIKETEARLQIEIEKTRSEIKEAENRLQIENQRNRSPVTS